MRYVRYALSLIVVIAALGVVSAEAQVTLAEAARAPSAGAGSFTLSGVVTLPPGIFVDAMVIRLRDAVTGEILGTTIAGPNGEFTFPGLGDAEYFLEVLDQNGLLLSASSSLTLGAGEAFNAILRVPSGTTFMSSMVSNAVSTTSNAFTNTAGTVLANASSAGVTGLGGIGPAVSPER